MRKHLSTVSLVAVMLIGLSLLLYPTLSDRWNSCRQSHAIVRYHESVDELDPAEVVRIWAAAQAYNTALPDGLQRFMMSDDERIEYEALLNIAGDGVMGSVEIPSIGVSLPIYHGTGAALQTAVGHIEGSSLPVGGKGTHAALSGHRGLPSARLFTDLDRLREGDRFYLHILDRTLAYEIDRIQTVLPEDMSGLGFDPQLDLCTLVTCTPYGVNSHRLLVRGQRVDG